MNLRQKQLLEKLRRQEKLLIEDEAREFAVSSMTIRRDLRLFEEKKLAVLVHGGAVLSEKKQNEVEFLTKSTQNQKLIAQKTLDIIQDASTIMLSVGSTTLEIARQIAMSSLNLTVITNSIPVATVLFQSNIQVILPGGTLRTNSMDLVGPMTEKNLSEFQVDLLISGCDAADSTSGFYTSDLNLASTEQKSVTVSEKVIITTESQKFTKRSFVKFANLNDVSTVITDNALGANDEQNLLKSGINLIKA